MPEEQQKAEPYAEPEHPDYERLRGLVQTLVDTPAQAGTFDIVRLLHEKADPQSVSYTAIARAVAFLQIKDPKEMQERMDETLRHALFWSEGFAIGSHFERTDWAP